MSRTLIAALVLPLFLLVACGGGGGESTTLDEPDTTVDVDPGTSYADCWGDGGRLCSDYRGTAPARVHAMAIVKQGAAPSLVCMNNNGTSVSDIMVCAGDAIVWENQLEEDVTLEFPDARTLFWSAGEGSPNTLRLRAGERTWSVVREDAAVVDEDFEGHKIAMTVGPSLDPDPIIKVKK